MTRKRAIPATLVYACIALIACVAFTDAAAAQAAPPAGQSRAANDTSATTALARSAIQKFCPSVLSDTTDPGMLFVVVSADGNLLNATHGTLEDFDILKAKYESFESKVESMEIKTVPAGALLRRALPVAITKFK